MFHAMFGKLLKGCRETSFKKFPHESLFPLLFAQVGVFVKRRIKRVEIAAVQILLRDAEVITDFTHSNNCPFPIVPEGFSGI